MYNDKIRERFRNPKFSGEMKDPSGVGEVGNAKCGDIMKVFIKVGKGRDGKEIVEDISYLTYGCVAAIASTDYLCEIVKGMPLEEAEKITSKDVIKRMGEVPAVKVHCSVLAQDALKDAIKNYREKK